MLSLMIVQVEAISRTRTDGLDHNYQGSGCESVPALDELVLFSSFSCHGKVNRVGNHT
jgi:hypothetical protein